MSEYGLFVVIFLHAIRKVNPETKSGTLFYISCTAPSIFADTGLIDIIKYILKNSFKLTQDSKFKDNSPNRNRLFGWNWVSWVSIMRYHHSIFKFKSTVRLHMWNPISKHIFDPDFAVRSDEKCQSTDGNQNVQFCTCPYRHPWMTISVRSYSRTDVSADPIPIKPVRTGL